MRKLAGLFLCILSLAYLIDSILGAYVQGLRVRQLPVFALGVLLLAVGSNLLRRPGSKEKGSHAPAAARTDLESVRAALTAKLPAKYDLLMLTFHGQEATQTGDMIVIGDDDSNKLCLYSRDGHIRSVDETGQYPSRFVNSSIDQFAGFLAEFERVSNQPKAATAEERTNRIHELRATLQTIDFAALNSPATWWSNVLDQMQNDRL